MTGECRRKGKRHGGKYDKGKDSGGSTDRGCTVSCRVQGRGIPGAINIPLPLLPLRLSELEPRTAPIVLYCASGARSGQGMRFLKQNGFTDVINAGGLEDMPE